jgi:hypothetical protein
MLVQLTCEFPEVQEKLPPPELPLDVLQALASDPQYLLFAQQTG